MSEDKNNQFKRAIKVGQYFNTAGVRVFGRAIFKNRALFVPQLRVRSIAKVNFQGLRDYAGVKYLVFDKDNTLTVPYDRSLHDSIKKEFARCKEINGPQNMAILSNSVGSKEDKGHKEA